MFEYVIIIIIIIIINNNVASTKPTLQISFDGVFLFLKMIWSYFCWFIYTCIIFKFNCDCVWVYNEIDYFNIFLNIIISFRFKL